MQRFKIHRKVSEENYMGPKKDENGEYIYTKKDYYILGRMFNTNDHAKIESIMRIAASVDPLTLMRSLDSGKK